MTDEIINPDEKDVVPEPKYRRYVFNKPLKVSEAQLKTGRKNYYKNRSLKLAYGKAYYAKNRSRISIQSAQRNQRMKELVMKHYGSHCSCCGETKIEFLVIDHIDGGGNAHRKKIGTGGCAFYHWLIKNNYPEGFRVLCHNCNMSYGHYGYCPHEKEGEMKDPTKMVHHLNEEWEEDIE